MSAAILYDRPSSDEIPVFTGFETNPGYPFSPFQPHEARAIIFQALASSDGPTKRRWKGYLRLHLAIHGPFYYKGHYFELDPESHTILVDGSYPL